jgi:serine/threonine-protein kinase
MEGDEASGWRPGKTRTYLDDPDVNEQEPTFSPDGRWIAYLSTEAGQFDVFVRPFPDANAGKWQVSFGGGNAPAWGPLAKRELLFRGPERIMAAPYSVDGNTFRPDKSRVWSERQVMPRPRQRPFDLHPDGERLAVAIAPDTSPNAGQGKVVFIFNFVDELRRITGH